jgi:DNA-binding IclR family transcriptional regulator
MRFIVRYADGAFFRYTHIESDFIMKRKTHRDSTAASDESTVPGGVTALERGLRILNAFDQRTSVLTLSGVALRTGLNKSTILRLMVSLEGLGFIDRDEEGLYHIGAQAWRVGMLFNSELHLEKLLPSVLDELSAKVDESASFWIPVLTTPVSRLCIFRTEPQRSVRVHTFVGSQMPLEKGGSTARMMRAYVDPNHRDDDRLRAERVCTTWAERDPELCGVSSPVFGVDGRFVGVLSISAPIARRDRKWLESMKPIVLAAADKVTSKLGREHGGSVIQRRIVS